MKSFILKQRVRLFVSLLLLILSVCTYFVWRPKASKTYSAAPKPSIRQERGKQSGQDSRPELVANWMRLREDSLFEVNAVIAKSGTLVVSSYSGTFRSDDNGEHWIKTLPNPSKDLRLASNGHLYVLQKRQPFTEKDWQWQGELWESANFGASWSLLPSPDRLKESGIDFYDIDPARSSYLVASAKDRFVYRLPFGTITDIQVGAVHAPITGLEVTDNGLVYVTAGELYRSSDGGRYFHRIAPWITQLDDDRRFTLRSSGDKLLIHSGQHVHIIGEDGIPAGAFSHVRIAQKWYVRHSSVFHVVPGNGILIYDQRQREVIHLSNANASVIANLPPEVGDPTSIYFDAGEKKVYVTTQGTQTEVLYSYATHKEGLQDYHLMATKGSLLRLDIELPKESGEGNLLTVTAPVE